MAEIEKFNSEGKVYTMVNNLNKVNAANYTYYTEEVKLKKDETKFVISAVAEGQLACNIPNEEKFTVKVRTRGGVKLDFSTGLFANFGSSRFHGDEYYYKPVDTDHSSIEKVDAGKRVGLSIGALLHIYKRSPADVKLGFSLGASTTTDADVLNFHVGPTLLLGDEERFCLSFGLTLREVKVLDRRYTLGTSYAKSMLPEVVPTIKKFPEAGTFVSLTYNFTRFNK